MRGNSTMAIHAQHVITVHSTSSWGKQRVMMCYTSIGVGDRQPAGISRWRERGISVKLCSMQISSHGGGDQGHKDSRMDEGE